MFADKTLRCDCGYEVQESDDDACVREVRRHASEAHGIQLSDELARDLVRRRRLSHGGQTDTTQEEER